MSSDDKDAKRAPGAHSVPDAAPIPSGARGVGLEDEDWVLGGEAAVPQRNYGPPIPSRFPTPQTMAGEIRELERRFRSRLTPLLPVEPPRNLPFRFLWSRYRRLAMRGRSEAVDDFGRDPVFAARIEPVLDFLSDRYFRIQHQGLQNVPATGSAMLVVNHAGALPFDTVMLMHLLKRLHPPRRQLRPLIEDFLFHAPYVGVLLSRLGAVRACPDNGTRLLNDGHLVAVFPEGEKGAAKLYRNRYKLQRFGRGGFIKLALRTGVPIIPVAVVGAEETHPLLGKVTHLAKPVGVPFLPLTPTFPWLGPLGLFPLPAKWRVHFGAPIDLRAEHDADAANDRLLVTRLAAEVRDQVQGLVDQALSARGAPYL